MDNTSLVMKKKYQWMMPLVSELSTLICFANVMLKAMREQTELSIQQQITISSSLFNIRRTS